MECMLLTFPQKDLSGMINHLTIHLADPFIKEARFGDLPQ